ncbi:MAG TPA: NAD(P)-dependent oxidoreductase [Gammaproteobacteria bacterium]|nr:NAD(P)-dependent oxidoreductase [Gammaproteobacteria bacterium]
MAHYYVTGAAGWSGKALVNRLVNGFPENETLGSRLQVDSVSALVLPHEKEQLTPWRNDIDVSCGDLRNPEDCTRFLQQAGDGILIHLAGVIHPRLFAREFMQVNVEGSQNLLSAAIRNNVQRAVVMSSNSPLGCNPDREHLFDESSAYNPYMGYGKSKMLLEQYVNGLQGTAQLETVMIRGPWFYGPFQPPRQTTFFEMIRDGKAPIVGDGNNLRSMVFVDNLAQGLLLAAVSGNAAGQTYWIADEKPYTMNEVINTVEYLLANEFKIECKYSRMKLPSVVSEIAYLCDWLLQSAGLYHQKIHVLSEMNKNIACSIQKAKNELGYQPLVSLEQGMRISIQSLIDQGQLK